MRIRRSSAASVVLRTEIGRLRYLSGPRARPFQQAQAFGCDLGRLYNERGTNGGQVTMSLSPDKLLILED